MKDRMKMLMEALHMNQQSFASFTGIAPASVSSVLQERTRPTLKMVESLYNKIPNLSLEWLMTGKGEMFMVANQPKADGVVGEETETVAASSAPRAEHAPLALDFSFDQAPTNTGSGAIASGAVRTTSQRSPHVTTEMKNVDKPSRRITEIRVFYDDQTWESFVPKK